MLKGKIAIVTGASRGIGLEIGHVLASQGAHIVCVATQQARAEEVASELAQMYGVETLGLGVDVSQSADVQGMIKSTMVRFGRIDILVNNAGITRDNVLLRLSDDDWQQVLNVDLNSVFYTTKAVLRPMMKQRYGRIVNMGSVVGVMGNAGQSNYAAAKAGMIGFSKSVAKEYGGKGITCNVVAPGFIETDMVATLPKEYVDHIIESIPQQRLGSSRDVANLVLFLASDLSSYITGEVIRVDGGMRM